MANRVSEVPDNTVSLVETQEYLKTVRYFAFYFKILFYSTAMTKVIFVAFLF